VRILIVGSGSWSHPIWRGLLQAVIRLRHEGDDVLHLWTNHDQAEAPRLVAEFDPEVAIAYGNNRLERLAPWRPVFAPLRCPRAMQFNDLRSAGRAGEIAGMFDAVFLCWSRTYRSQRVCSGQNFSHRMWQKRADAKVLYMPQAGGYHELRWPQESQIGVFVGDLDHPTFHKGRRRLCNELRMETLNEHHRHKRNALMGRMPTLYRKARYCLSTSPKVPGYTSARTYKILSCGGLLLLDYFPDSERLFQSGRHALVFKSMNQAKRMMAEWGENAVGREQIRLAGRKLQLERHTIYHRLRNMIANLTTTDTTFWGWL